MTRRAYRKIESALRGVLAEVRDDTAARALHASCRTLSFMRWDQLQEDTKAEYRRDAAEMADLLGNTPGTPTDTQIDTRPSGGPASAPQPLDK